jgi:hypothetical protein
MTMLEAALAWAKAGYPVFPCKQDKSPYTAHGYKDATTDPAIITAWWTKWPNALIAVPTGKETFDVLDLDVKNGKNGPAHVPDWQRGQLQSPSLVAAAHICSTNQTGRSSERPM